MNNGRHTRKSAPGGRNNKAMAIAITVLLLTAVVGGTLAFLTDQTDPVVNTFEATDVTCYVAETFDGITKSAVKVQNTGKVNAYIRVAVVDNFVKSVEGKDHICSDHEGTAPVVNGTGWSQGSDGFYYYSQPVAPGEYTSNLFTNEITMTSHDDCCVEQLEILASAIQATDAAVADW